MAARETDSDAAAWASKLSDAGCVVEALSLERGASASADCDQAMLALAGGRSDAAAPLLGRLRDDPRGADPRLIDWLCSVLAASGGVETALPEVIAGANALAPSPAVDRLVVRAAAGVGRLEVVGSAGTSLPSAYPLDTDLMTVVAAGRASSGDPWGAWALCQRCEALGDDEAGSRALDLLLAAGDRDRAVQVAVVGSHSAKPGAERRRWRGLAKKVVPGRDTRDWLELGAGIVFLAPLALLGLPGILLAAAVVWAYRTFVRRRDRDPVTRELLHAHRTGVASETRIPAADGFTAFFGAILGMMAGAALMGNSEQSAAVAAITFVTPALLVPAALVASRRWAARRLLTLEDERKQRLTDKTCRCYGTVGFRGPSGRRYLSAHLSPAGSVRGGSSSMHLLRCPSTGMHFLDVPERGVTVAVQPRTTEPATNDAGVGLYL